MLSDCLFDEAPLDPSSFFSPALTSPALPSALLVETEPTAVGLKIRERASSYSCCRSSYVFFLRRDPGPVPVESESEPPEVELPREEEVCR